MAIDFKIRSTVLSNGRKAFYGRVVNSNEQEFLIGYQTKYEDRFGLYNTTEIQGLKYNPVEYADQFGFYAHFIFPTVQAESKSSLMCLNTYDRARFTFGFMQFAAHVPNGDFVKYLRDLLGLPNAVEYFPRLRLINDRIHYQNDNSNPFQLEFDNSTEELMKYLNPGSSDIEHQETICAARMIHWVKNDPLHRKVQIEAGVNLYKNNMIRYHNRFNLQGFPAKVCLLICDILHQGRGTFDRISYAIDTKGNYQRAYNNLCRIGEANYKERINTIKSAISNLERQGIFNKVYDNGSNTFM